MSKVTDKNLINTLPKPLKPVAKFVRHQEQASGLSTSRFIQDATTCLIPKVIFSRSLADLTEKVLSKINVILITLGGETSYKCCKAIKSNELKLVDEVAPAISICSDINNRWIVTKSGNLGNTKTLIEILNYFKFVYLKLLNRSKFL